MTDQRALTRIDHKQESLDRAVVLQLQLPAKEVRFLDRAVIVIARAGGGAGADGVAALLSYIAESVGAPVTLVDFCLEGDEGAAWGSIGGLGSTRKRLVVSAEMGAELGDEISQNLDGIVIINTPPNTLLDVADAEREFLPVITELQRPFIVFWIDRPNDQAMDRMAGYQQAGGSARWVVGVLAKTSDRYGDGQHVNVRPPADTWVPIRIPLFPSQIADLFYGQRLSLSAAVKNATVGSKAAFFARLKAFVLELGFAI